MNARIVALVILTPALACLTRAADAGAAAPLVFKPDQRVLVLGMDGLDPKLLKHLMDAGACPTFKKLAERGTFKPLGTSMPPQSPVAWSNFISGAHPGVHQIYDFIHRNLRPSNPAMVVEPMFSTSRINAPGESWLPGALPWRGDYQIPLLSPTNESLRRGPQFWDALTSHGVKCVLYRVPANYPPPKGTKGAPLFCMCGMGTPDLLGGYGTFTLYTPNAPLKGKAVSGGRLEFLFLDEHGSAELTLGGGANFLRTPDAQGFLPDLEYKFRVTRDPEAKVAKIELADQTLVLQEGEWSDWVQVRFQTGIPGGTVLGALGLPTEMPAAVRFYMKQVHPLMELYVTPLNIDPLEAFQAVSTPPDFAEQVARITGRYHTTGIPEDTAALEAGALDEDEFLQQVRLLVDERFAQYRAALRQFDRGLLFFYFGHTDQLAHMFWRDRDPGHPGRVEEQAVKYHRVIEDTYIEMDGLLAETLATLGDDVPIVVMSDHGFNSFRRGFNLNTWLLNEGYLVLKPDGRRRVPDGVDWSRTKAYALGINSLFVNLQGREAEGIVAPGDAYHALLDEIDAKLRQVRDVDGAAPVVTTYVTESFYPGSDMTVAPDLLIGYNENYRGSWGTVLGSIPRELIQDNKMRWSGDHCIEYGFVPGSLVTNLKLTGSDPTLSDIGPSLLGLYGIKPMEGMTGRALLAPPVGMGPADEPEAR